MISRIVKEPLVHFLLIGGLIFAAYSVFDDRPTAPTSQQIVITQADLSALSAQFESVWKRKPQPQEFSSMIEEMIRDRVLVNAALDLGMDQGDTVINRRLRQKMEFFAASIAEAVEPEDGELEAFYQANSQNYQIPPQFALEQFYLGDRAAANTVASALAALKNGTDPERFRHPSLLPERVEMSSMRVLDSAFGTGFAASLESLSIGEWSGPVKSGYGLHLVRLTGKSPTTHPALEQVADKVFQDWQSSKRQEVLDQYYQSLRQGYEITLPTADDAS
ncbi:peptidylprolyl isomerase [Parasedimentitalea psychrophila]|uniref:Parvulin-like PPIase n=1 Tax=Parasedimentitalea psychrophila TaxID=2997337 RepID=A0A9Y2KWG8_9RHOB|nr:peptidylprolyl isomerase [Parasedimentitalea psychrophila]WIY24431.1 peptidylprolyl isomerase [Parasedimentitalea psychrophila]